MPGLFQPRVVLRPGIPHMRLSHRPHTGAGNQGHDQAGNQSRGAGIVCSAISEGGVNAPREMGTGIYNNVYPAIPVFGFVTRTIMAVHLGSGMQFW